MTVKLQITGKKFQSSDLIMNVPWYLHKSVSNSPCFWEVCPIRLNVKWEENHQVFEDITRQWGEQFYFDLLANKESSEASEGRDRLN